MATKKTKAKKISLTKRKAPTDIFRVYIPSFSAGVRGSKTHYRDYRAETPRKAREKLMQSMGWKKSDHIYEVVVTSVLRVRRLKDSEIFRESYRSTNIPR